MNAFPIQVGIFLPSYGLVAGYSSLQENRRASYYGPAAGWSLLTSGGVLITLDGIILRFRSCSAVNLASDASLTYLEGFGSCCSLLAVRSVWQHYAPTPDVLGLLEMFRRMVNESILIGLANDVSSLRRLSLLSYSQLAQYDSPSYYKLCAISRAAGILAARKKSIRRGFTTGIPYTFRQQLVSCYGFKIRNGALDFPVSRGKRFSIPFTRHVLEVISQPGVDVRSFALSRTRLCL